MKIVERSEVLGLAEYEQLRPHFRGRIIAEKRERRLSVGPMMTAMFENRETVLLQIQEMLRTERITKESGITHEIATYNELVPGDNELSFSLFIEIADKDERERMLEALVDVEDTVAIEVGDESFAATGKREGVEPGRTTAIHYLKVTLSPQAVAALEDDGVSMHFLIGHAAYQQRIPIVGAVRQQLRADLGWSS